jgi:DoxX-like family
VTRPDKFSGWHAIWPPSGPFGFSPIPSLIRSAVVRGWYHMAAGPWRSLHTRSRWYSSPVAEPPGIYVEICIRSTVDEIWRRTQTPELHQQWDLRFTSIDYVPGHSESEPQKFFYSTRIGFGLRVDGEGESTGTSADVGGGRTSALSFWSRDPKSIISKGSGYWKYAPMGKSVRFLTWYDYSTRLGVVGRLVDRFAFRPLIGWATAWSFDRLRLWIECDIPPDISFRMTLIHACTRACIAFIWVWQGLFPKLVFANSDEKFMLTAAGAPIYVLPAIGIVEIVFGILGVAVWRWRGFFILNAVMMLVALLEVALRSPSYLFAAFNPVTLNIGVIGLSLLGYLSGKELPSAGRCLRRPK